VPTVLLDQRSIPAQQLLRRHRQPRRSPVTGDR